MSLLQILFVSRRAASDPVTRSHHWIDIGRVAAHHNVASDVTGCLMGSAGHFIQVLEGRTPVIERLFTRIGHDPRHDSLVCLGYRTIRNRSFNSWSDVCLNGDPSAAPALARHGLSPSLGPHDLSMPIVLSLAMTIADAARIARLSPVARRPCQATYASEFRP